MRHYLSVLGMIGLAASLTASKTAAPTYSSGVAEILQKRCQSCHRPGEIAPMAFTSYSDTRPWAKAIKTAVMTRKMPPWFADPKHGTFLNDRSLSKVEIDTLVAWVDAGAPEGKPMPPAPITAGSDGWRIGRPDLVIELPKAFQVPATGEVPYQYISVPTGLTEDKWVRAVEVRPGNRKVVHHIIASSHEPGRGLVMGRKAGEFFTFDLERARAAQQKSGQEPPQFAAAADSEMLQVFVPGGVEPDLKPGQAKLVKAGSNILFQLHYTTTGKPEEDRTRIGLIFADEPPKERVKSVLVFNTRFTIPAGAQNHELRARATVLSDLKMVAMLPHMHLRGKDFLYRAIYPSGETETLLSVPRYDFNWQISYYLKEPKVLPKGTILECVGHYDNSANNPHNPDPKSDVHYGEQTWEEMLNGFMDVAIAPAKETPPIFGPAAAAGGAGFAGGAGSAGGAGFSPRSDSVTFHKDVLPVLQRNCQSCHRSGEVAPMPLLTYAEARPWAKAIRAAVIQKKMPPWFADAAHGTFANNRELSKRDQEVLTSWADTGALEGDPKDAPKPLEFAEGWSIGKPDAIIEMPREFTAPASGDIPYQYILVNSGLTEDRWIEAAEIRPGNRSIVHHVIAFALPPKSKALAFAKVGDFLDAEAIAKRATRKPGDPEPKMFHSGTDSEAFGFFVPGFQPHVLKPGQARLLKAGSVIMFQLHYTPAGKAQTDRTRIGLRFATEPPVERVKTVNVQNFAFTVPPKVDDYPVYARARLIRDFSLVAIQPHMHVRGKSWQFRATYPSGETEILLNVPRWDFNWQLSYLLASPKRLPKGTVLEVTGVYDNSVNNRFNPDPSAEVVYGEQTWNEMLAAMMDVAVNPTEGDPELFEPVRPKETVAGRYQQNK